MVPKGNGDYVSKVGMLRCKKCMIYTFAGGVPCARAVQDDCCTWQRTFNGYCGEQGLNFLTSAVVYLSQKNDLQ